MHVTYIQIQRERDIGLFGENIGISVYIEREIYGSLERI